MSLRPAAVSPAPLGTSVTWTATVAESGAGPLEVAAVTPIAGIGATSAQSLIFADGSLDKITFIPGMKVNLIGKMVLSLNALVTMKNNGLHSKITPVAGINLTK